MSNEQDQEPATSQSTIVGRLRFSPVLGHVSDGRRWLARLANTVEDPTGRLITVEFRGDRADVAVQVLSSGCHIRASGRWSDHRFDVDRFDVVGEDPSSQRRYRFTSAEQPEAQQPAATATDDDLERHRDGRPPSPPTEPELSQPEPDPNPGHPPPAGSGSSGPVAHHNSSVPVEAPDPQPVEPVEESPEGVRVRELRPVHSRLPGPDGAIRL
jgi:hypothetical protein